MLPAFRYVCISDILQFYAILRNKPIKSPVGELVEMKIPTTTFQSIVELCSYTGTKWAVLVLLHMTGREFAQIVTHFLKQISARFERVCSNDGETVELN